MKTTQWTSKKEQEETEEDRITIEDINITTKMNTSQMAIEKQENTNTEEESNTEETPTHDLNLRNQPTRCTEKVFLTQTGYITELESDTTTGVGGNIMTIHPKSHAHIMLTQVNAMQGLLK